jgi:hypothetical protein
MKTQILIIVCAFIALGAFGAFRLNNSHKPESKEEIGEHFDVIEGFKVHRDFRFILHDPAWSCWAKKPASNYTIHQCSLCNCYYLSQDFYGADNNTYSIIKYASGCKKSPTSFCDGLSLKEMGPCKCLGISIYKSN